MRSLSALINTEDPMFEEILKVSFGDVPVNESAVSS
jgi:hypothetical protein